MNSSFAQAVKDAIVTGEYSFTAIQWKRLSHDSNALPLLIDNPSRVDWRIVSSHEWAVPLLMQYPERVAWARVPIDDWVKSLIDDQFEHLNWSELSKHRIVLLAIASHSDRIVWANIPSEEWALALLIERPRIANWPVVSQYEWAAPLLRKYPNMVVWNNLPSGDWATQLLKLHPRKMRPRQTKRSTLPTPHSYPDIYEIEGEEDITQVPLRALIPRTVAGLVEQAKTTGRYEFTRAQWDRFSNHPDALSILIKYPNKVRWSIVSQNTWAIPLMVRYPDRIDWQSIGNSPAVLDAISNDSNNLPFQFLAKEKLGDAFSIGYPQLKISRQWLLPELMEYLYHPRFIQRWVEDDNELEDYLN